MDKSAIEEIGRLAVAAQKAQILDTHDPAALVGDRLVSLEHLQEHRTRMSGNFETDRLDDFCAYVGSNSQSGVPVFVAASDGVAQCYLDMGTLDKPGHCEHSATLELAREPEFHAALSADNGQMSQRELAEFIEDWSDHITLHKCLGGDVLDTSAAIAAIRNVKSKATSDSSHSDRDFGARVTAAEEIEVSSTAGTLPGALVFRCIPYAGFREAAVEMRISALLGGDKPAFKLRIVGREVLLDGIANEMRELIHHKLIGATIYMGSFEG